MSLIFILLIGACKSEVNEFNFEGRKILYTQSKNGETQLVLFNIDTGERLNLSQFEYNASAFYRLYNNGRNILIVTPGNPSFFYIYDMILKKKNLIQYPGESNILSTYYNHIIFNDTLYFTNENKVISYSLTENKIIKKYNFQYPIYSLAVQNSSSMAINYFSIDDTVFNVGERVLYQVDSTYEAIVSLNNGEQPKFSNDGKYFVSYLDFNPYITSITEFPSLTAREINNPIQDSIMISGECFFLSNNSIVFPGKSIHSSSEGKNLFLYDLEKDSIIKQLTFDNSVLEIKSTCY